MSIETVSTNWDLRTSTSIDRSRNNPEAVRRKPMRLLAMGFPRTATMSTVAALEKLGFNGVYHGLRLLENPPDISLWRKAIKAKRDGRMGKDWTKKDWDALLGHVEATTDFPSILFPEELIATYPEAKVILNVRDTQSWWKSAKGTVFRKGAADGPFAVVLDAILYWFAPFISMWLRLVWDTILLWGIKGSDVDVSCPALYEKHNALVQKLVPPERFLKWGPQDGWEPLCKFLDLPIPDGPVPHINETAVIKRNIQSLVKRELKVAAGRMALLIGIICFALRYMGYLSFQIPYLE